MKYDNMWKKDWSAHRRQDALLFIKEAKLEKKTSKKQERGVNPALIPGALGTGFLANRLGNEGTMFAGSQLPKEMKYALRDYISGEIDPDIDTEGMSQAVLDKVEELKGKGVTFHGDTADIIDEFRPEVTKEVDKIRKRFPGLPKELMDGFEESRVKSLEAGLNPVNFGGALYLDAPTGKKIVSIKGMPEAILAHEMGHADASTALGRGVRRIGSAGQLVTRLTGGKLSPATAALGMGYAGLSNKTPEERDRALRNAQIATGIAGTPEFLTALEEGRANMNALATGRKAGKTMEYAKALMPAYGTYLGQAAKPLLGIGALAAARKMLSKDKNQKKPMTKAAALTRGKLIGGATVLGALGLGGSEHLKSRVDPVSGITRREAAAQALDAQNQTYESLTGKRRNPLLRRAEKASEDLGRKMDERRDIAIPAKAAIGATIGGLSAKKALDFIQANARVL